MSAATARVNLGEVLAGKYRVERVLGSGGMGMVVAARHIELGQRVALKLMLKEAMADPAHAERFLREARAAVQLQSAHTARVLDVGRLANGEPFMVMEYLEGEDLDELLHRTGTLPPHRAVDLMMQVCEAFAEAHALGMIHRDIKLKNLFLTKTVDGRPFVKVLDFGLAKQIGVGQKDISLTATSAVFGSPQYMSPEQMRSAKDVDARSDIWSIGVCLYELLTGRVPFDANGLAEICAMVLKDPVPPPSQFAPVPPDLEAVVMQALEKDPSKRFQTVAELASALEPWGALEGSAIRVHQVMRAAQKAELPTLVNENPPRAGAPKTLSASAWATTPDANASWKSPNVRLFLGASAATAFIGFAAIALVLVGRDRTASHGVVATQTPVAAEPSAPPAPTVEAPPPSATAVAGTAAPIETAPAAPPRPPTEDTAKPALKPPPPATALRPPVTATKPPVVAPKPTTTTKPSTKPGLDNL